MNKAKEENITTHQQKKEQTENRIFFKKTKILIFFSNTSNRSVSWFQYESDIH